LRASTHVRFLPFPGIGFAGDAAPFYFHFLSPFCFLPFFLFSPSCLPFFLSFPFFSFSFCSCSAVFSFQPIFPFPFFCCASVFISFRFSFSYISLFLPVFLAFLS
jgi:hypothetical protein